MWHGWYMERCHPTAPVMPGLHSRQRGDESGTAVKKTPSAREKRSILQAAGSCLCKSTQEVWWD